MHFRQYWPRTTFSDDVKAALFEFVGTTVFLLLAYGGTQGSNEVEGSHLERSLYIATAFGLSLLVSAWFFFRATGGLFNPDVSLALLLIGAIAPVRFILYCIAQLTGAIAAAAIVLALTPGPVTYKYVACLQASVVRLGLMFVKSLAHRRLARFPQRTLISPRACSSKCSLQRRSVSRC